MGHSPVNKMAPSELEALVTRAKAGDEGAFSDLVRLTKNRLYRFLFFLSQDAALANDLSQDSYLYALEHLKSLQEPAAFPRWLFLIAKNRFLDYRRSPRNKPYDDVADLDPEFAGGDRELALQTKEVLAQLPEAERFVLLTVDLEGFSYAEASEIIGISEAAVRSRLHRARTAFYKIYFKA